MTRPISRTERVTSYGDRQRTGRQRWLPGWRNRRHRRPLVILLAVGPAAMLAAVAMQSDDIIDDPLWFAGLSVTVAVWILLCVLTSAVTIGSTRKLDERERALRDRYSSIGYQFALVSMPVLFIFLGVTGDVPSLQLHAFGLAYTLWLVTFVLPTALLAWNLADEDPEDVAGPADEPQA